MVRDMNSVTMGWPCSPSSAERSIIPYSEVDRIEKRESFTLDPVAGLSFRRVTIIVNGKVRVQVSPDDRDGFIGELQKRIDKPK